MYHISFKGCSKSMWSIELVCISTERQKEFFDSKKDVIMKNKVFK